ncbi:phosphoribosylamine--glycine ligase [Maridesulfovibrio hydrothermalis]|uniref:Phosphoribosylamine--glycine ligase n=1 Tax=Maridesulfovibrio hydrothermalis AM13 = DSM 14728 TaxID=1121451 RepID=L0RAZ3_9BACT|nr:phosphoribosylamine--glycine ligase [Maridesulfovibrio hydrothermalis]CCO23365.1 phosphoribosylglycinamide synthetase phosphoribosylamine-glycine ligase [Maridesulfovibrio hydrothermalis AM13 = DSM 14728]
MKVLVVGSGGREHALAWRLGQSPKVSEIFIAPGNGGTRLEGINVPIKDDDLPGLVNFAKENKIDLVVAGPELPLVLGIKEALSKEGIPCFGPGAYAANLEGSKAFSKMVMRDAGVPTAPFKVFDEFDQAKAFVENKGAPIVVKADGLAAGKGVVVASTVEEAIEALDDMMVKREFGTAGERVVVEEALKGEEASFLAFCAGEDYALLPSAQDHKAVGEGDTGPNTGGMGAYSPAPILPREKYEETAELVIKPILKLLADRGEPFTGILYAGLMYTDDGPSVLEYNVRFGDPECQPLLMRLDTDIVEIMLACVENRLPEVEVKLKDETAICVVMAAGGYPASYGKGKEICGIEEAEKLEGVKVFQAGTKYTDGKTLTNGGRVLGVTALGADLGAAQKRAYEAVEKLSFEDAYFRRDIGDKGLKK